MRSAGGCDPAGNSRVVYWSIQLKRNRADEIRKVVSHHQCVSSLDAKRAKQRRARQRRSRSFFDRLATSRVDEVSQFDVLGVFGAAQGDETADQLLARRTSDFDVGIERRTKVWRKRNSNVVAENVDPKRRNCKPFEQSAACRRNAPAADRAVKRIDLGLVGA